LGKYLKELIIKNFQSHLDTTLNFVPGVNMITGENSAGKSAVFRAMRFLAYNKPAKDVEKGLLRKGKNSIVIKATMSDDSWVLREKGKDINRYIVYDEIIAKEYGGPLELNNFGLNIPEEVGRILGMAPVTLSQTKDIEINISSQNESAFMLSNSSPEIARWVYSLTHLDDVRYAIDDLNRDYRKCGDNIKDHNNRIQILQDDLNTLGDIKAHDKKLGDLEVEDMLLSEKISYAVELEQLYNAMVLLKQKAIPTKNRIDKLNIILEKIELEELNKDLDKLNNIINIDYNLNILNNKISKVNNIIEKIKPLSEIKINDIDNNISIINKMNNIYHSCISLDNKINITNKNINTLQTNIQDIDNKIEKIKNQIFKNKDNPCCPICGSCIDESLMGHIIEELDHGKDKQ